MLKKLLLQGKAVLGLHVAVIGRIHDQRYHVYSIDTDYGGIEQGDVFDLGETYCKDVVARKKTMTYDDVAEITEMLKHPCYQNTQLRAYIGTPILVDNRVWGTLSFSSLSPKEPNFTAADYHFVDSLADQITQLLSARPLISAIQNK